jgi:hypothetical protein
MSLPKYDWLRGDPDGHARNFLHLLVEPEADQRSLLWALSINHDDVPSSFIEGFSYNFTSLLFFLYPWGDKYKSKLLNLKILFNINRDPTIHSRPPPSPTFNIQDALSNSNL